MLADTAGRLPTQAHLMEELRKVQRVLGKAQPGAPHEVLLVLDANTGQNALAQVKAFDAAVGLTGLIVTKLDGSAKGGVVAAIAKQHPVPLKFIGVGEGVDDLRPFVAARVRRRAAARRTWPDGRQPRCKRSLSRCGALQLCVAAAVRCRRRRHRPPSAGRHPPPWRRRRKPDAADATVASVASHPRPWRRGPPTPRKRPDNPDQLLGNKSPA